MATLAATIGTAAKNLLVFVLGDGSIVAPTVLVDSSGTEKATSGNPLSVAVVSGGSSTATTTASQSTALEAGRVLKSSPGNLIASYVTTGATAGYLMLFDAISVPGDGAVTPAACVYCPANATTSLDYPAGAPRRFATGIAAAFSSTGPFTKTGSATAFIEGLVV